jgi:hypothetical protein
LSYPSPSHPSLPPSLPPSLLTSVPLEVIITRIITSQGRVSSWAQATKEVLEEDGVEGLYKGITTYVRREGERDHRGKKEAGV